jgi:phage RecT family recombinase
MTSEIDVIERELGLRMPMIDNILAASPALPAKALFGAFMAEISRENSPVRNCSLHSLMSCAVSTACLGLMPGSPMGQIYFLPFRKDGMAHAVPVIGYKGYNTIAGRSGFTVSGACVREGDAFDYELGSAGYITHKPELGNSGAIIGAWAVATSNHQPPIIAPPLSARELLEIKDRSQGARRQDSPWNDPRLGYPAMCEKSAKRRLARQMPVQLFMMADAMETQQDLGHAAYIDPDKGVVANGEAIPVEKTHIQKPLLQDKKSFVINKGSDTYTCADITEYQSKMLDAINSLSTRSKVMQFHDYNKTTMWALLNDFHPQINAVFELFTERLDSLA